MADFTTNNIQLGREAEVYVCLESPSAPGTLTWPDANGLTAVSLAGVAGYDPAYASLKLPAALYIASTGNFNQQPSFTDSEEIANTRSLTNRFVDQAPAGTWDFNVYARMLATRGTTYPALNNSTNFYGPDAHLLYLAALGGYQYLATAIDSPSGLKVHKYFPAMQLPSLSIFFKYNDMVFACAGATVNEMKASITNKGAITWAFSGGFMRMRWIGKVALYLGNSGAAWTSETKKLTLATAGDYRYFAPGMKFQIYDESANGFVANTGANGGTVFTISTVNSADNSITLDSGDNMSYTAASGDYVSPWLPVSNKRADSVVLEARDGSVYFDSVGVNILSSDVTLTNNVKYQEDEVTTDDYPVSYIADRRNVTAATSLYFRRQTLPYFLKGYDKEHIEFSFYGVPPTAAQHTSGASYNAMLLHMPKVLGGVPALSGDLERQLAIDFTATADASKGSGIYYPDASPIETGKENELFLFFGDIYTLDATIEAIG